MEYKLENIGEVIKGCRAKEYKYQKMVYENYRGFALKVVFRYIHKYQKAVDIVNDCFVKIFTHFETFVTAGSEEENRKLLMGYIKRVVINAAIDELRKRNLQEEREIVGIPAYVWDLPGKGDDAGQKLLYKQLIIFIKELPANYRIVFNMCVIDGYSHAEIAEKLQIPVGTSKSHLSRAKKVLQLKLKKSEEQAYAISR